MTLPRAFAPEDFTVFALTGYDAADGRIETRYALEGPNAEPIVFTEVFDFTDTGATGAPNPSLMRLLALSACVSYYKTAAPSTVEIRFPVAQFEVDYLAAVIRGGLGEFAYENDLPDALVPTLVAEQVTDRVIESAPRAWDIGAAPLVAVGGGKDSIVTIEALKAGGFEPVLFSVNQYQPIDDTIDVSGLRAVRMRRRLDPKIGELNAAGAYNGHIPVTAINSVVGLIAADLMGLGSVIFSNEQSADIENLVWHGFDINHQWSKSIVYETLLRKTLAEYGMSSDRYFSLLRALPESEIAARFADHPEYFDVFISCNRSFALDPTRRRARWCGECAKCLFVFVILAPRIDKARLTEIFAVDPLDHATNLGLYRELAGLDKHKPFECVGDYAEVAEAFVELMDDDAWRGDDVVSELSGLRSRLDEIASNKAPIVGAGNVPAHYSPVFDALVSH
ncbi:hypothetical protein [Gordonia alkaliphila]|uniref:UDP-N-acetyl-alpha-D-muramoyl-L-alanyl-L-glutamate epimerase n=1 Tax=Gordonia alkaliphila TaxID=1053547 RepID=A0ABP8ZAR4_9ACTN